MKLRALALGVSVGLGVNPGEAAARSCIHHAWETLDLELVAVWEDGAPIAASALPFTVGEAINSARQGEWVLIRGEAHGAFFSIKEKFEPSAIQTEHVEQSAARRTRTGCGYSISYTPVRPGRYTYQEDWSGDEGSIPRNATLLVASDRQSLGLAYEQAGHRYEVEYRVTCAHYDWDLKRGERGPCGPAEDPSPVFGARRSPADAPRPVDREPPRIEPNAEVSQTRDPPPLEGARGACAVAPAGPRSALALALLVGFGRRRRVC